MSAATDHTPPTVSAPVVRLQSGLNVTFGSAAHATITIVGHDGPTVRQRSPEAAISRNGGPFVKIAVVPVKGAGIFRRLPNGTWTIATVLTRTFALSGTYRVRARMRDRAGNWSRWVAGPLLSPRRILETSPTITLLEQLDPRVRPDVRESYETASAAGETATLTFTARSIAWLSNMTLDHGTAEVRIDGVFLGHGGPLQGCVGLGSDRRAIFSKTWTSVSKHTLTITVLGTAGHPQVDVDGFLAIS